MGTIRKRAMAVALLGAVGLAAAIVASGASGHRAAGLKIAFLMPCSTCADRFEHQDKPLFIQAVKTLDPSIEVIANNAEGSGATQQSQAEAALTNGAKVLVMSPIEVQAGAAIVAKAAAEGVPTIAYDGQITGGAKPVFYVSFQNEQVGRLQARYLAAHLKKGATVVMINGAPDSAPGRQFKAGAHAVLDPLFRSGKLRKGFEGDAAKFDPANGQRLMEQALTKLHDRVDGVLVANDGLAQAVIVALKARHLNGKVLVTGQDATDAGLQQIVLGNQSMTVYKPIKSEAAVAARVAVALAKGDASIVSSVATTKVNNGTIDVPAKLLTPITVTKANIRATVIKDRFTTQAKICKGIPKVKCKF
jgi:D-xylose transport system substrate-binding protein